MQRSFWFWIALLSLASCNHEKPYEKPLTPVTVQAVEEYSGDSRPMFSGTIEPLTRVDVSFRSGGYVDEIMTANGTKALIKEGDVVPKGAVLARLRPADYDLKITQAKAQLDQAVAGLTQAQAAAQSARVSRDKAAEDLARASRLLKSESLTKVDYDSAKAQSDAAEQSWNGAQSQVEAGKARIEGAKAMMAEAQMALRDSAILAPIHGLVYKRNIELGALVAPGTPAFTLADASSVRVVFGAPDTMLSKLKIGQTLPLTTEAYPNTEFHGRVSRISPIADARSRVFEIEVTLPNPGNRLKAGMIASVEVGAPHPAAAVPVVPLGAIVRAKDNSGSYAVFTVNDQGGRAVLHRKDVKLGEAFGNRVAVLSGVTAGEKVVVTGASLVQDGETVQVIPPMQR